MRSPLNRPTLHLLAAALCAALPGWAAAQSLQSLYEAARGYDATYLSVRKAAEASQFRVEQAEGVSRPQASVRGLGTRSESRFASGAVASPTTTSATLNGSYALYNRTNSVNIEQARKALQVAQTDLEAAEQDLIVRVAQAYFDVLAAQDALTTIRASKAATAEQLASAKRNFEVGTATITDTREAQARFDLAVAQELAGENDLRNKRVVLDQLVGQSGVNPKPLLAPVVIPNVSPLDANAWVQRAEAEHPAIRKAMLGLEVAQLEMEKARAARMPTVDVTASLSTAKTTGVVVGIPGATNTGAVNLIVNMPLYTGGTLEGRISETTALEGKARFDMDAARRAVTQGTRVAYHGVQSGLAQVKALEAAEASTKLALEATQLGYKVGVRVNLDVLNSQSQLFTTQQNLAKARYDVLMGTLRLRQAAGALNPGDVNALNALLEK